MAELRHQHQRTNPGGTIELAETIRNTHGTEPFEELDGATERWESEEAQP